MINSFNDFYNNLSSNGLFFFWIVVFLFVFVIFLLVILLLKNRKLSKYLKENNIKEELNDTHEDTPLILSEAKEEPKEIVKELPQQEINKQKPAAFGCRPLFEERKEKEKKERIG